MSEMKAGSTDPKVIATVIIINHGTGLTHTEVGDLTVDAIGIDNWPEDGERIVNEVWNRVQDAIVTITWDDDKPSLAQACGGPCCGGRYDYGDEDDYDG
jgi:hypothetical protein